MLFKCYSFESWIDSPTGMHYVGQYIFTAWFYQRPQDVMREVMKEFGLDNHTIRNFRRIT